ncbi:hypothetical protein N7466_010613 [Penicillium verhagenii]|uniref:uncharacterized protein n=1 Tax=Penicillium verhagenii TaxID=1562060 RepID=UPI002545ACCA|nr:uncharacterized protein N7466_010613 [Penicillium verhagenii]KAJ5918621.1 hypothetical protein N7466_010613 [Penicillium verhagenii]
MCILTYAIETTYAWQEDLEKAADQPSANPVDAELQGRLQNQINNWSIVWKAMVETHKYRNTINGVRKDNINFSSFGLAYFTVIIYPFSE